jgi:hypothetical protein
MYPKLDKDQTVTGVSSHDAPNDVSKAWRNLRLDDFTRIRTIGEGTWNTILHENCTNLLQIYLTGTFARVCLVRLTSPKNKAERTKVFALKILRKTEGLSNEGSVWYLICDRWGFLFRLTIGMQ